MLSISGTYAIGLMKNKGLSKAEALANAEVYARKYNTSLTESDYNAIEKASEVKAMRNKKHVTRKTRGKGSNESIAFIKTVEYSKGINIKRLTRKTPKVSDCKVFKLEKTYGKNYKIVATFEITESNARITVQGDGIKTAEQITTIEQARQMYKKALKNGYTRPTEKTAKPCKSKESKPKKAPKKSTKKSTKKSAKKAPKKEPKKAQKAKKAPKKESKPKKELPVNIALRVRKGNIEYYFEIKCLDAYVEKIYIAEGRVEEARRMTRNDARIGYKALLDKGFKRVA